MPAQSSKWKRYPVEGVDVQMIPKASSGQTAGRLTLRGLSHACGALEGPPIPGGTQCKAHFIRNGASAFDADCTVARAWKENNLDYLAITFDPPLSDEALKQLGVDVGGEDHQLTVARADQDQVNREIGETQDCRSRVFLTATGTLTAGFFTLLATKSESGPVSGHRFLLAMGGVLVIWAIGSLSMAEKSRAINLRRGFLCALAPYLRGDKKFRDYWGWAQLKHCLGECKSLRAAETCSLRDVTTCHNSGEALAAGLNSHKRLMPGLTSSFTSLSAWIYGFGYVAFAVSFGQALCDVVGRSHANGEYNAGFYIFVLSGFAGFLVLHLSKWITVCLVLLGLVATVSTVLPLSIREAIPVIMFGMVVGLLGWFLGKQLHAIRLGKHSLETYAYAWVGVLERCDPVPFVDRAQRIPMGESIANRRTGSFATLRNLRDTLWEWYKEAWRWAANERSPRRVRDEYWKAAKNPQLPTAPPTVNIVAGGSGRHVLEISYGTTGVVRGMPLEGLCLEVWVALTTTGASTPTDPALFNFVALDTRTPFTMEYKAADRGKNAHYLLRWANAAGERGPWSETATATVAV